jgi:hypothetical protein
VIGPGDSDGAGDCDDLLPALCASHTHQSRVVMLVWQLPCESTRHPAAACCGATAALS